jgi:hypothetical protein
MTIHELLDLIRRPYIEQFSRAKAEAVFHIEPVLRRSDGSPATEGALVTPCRCDLVRKDTGASVAVNATERVRLEDLQVDIDGVTLKISAFSWDWLTLHIAGMQHTDATVLVRDWFLQWFDEDDNNSKNAEDFYGVVHFVSDPVELDGALQFQIDLGSAPATSVCELIEQLLERGPTGLTLS